MIMNYTKQEKEIILVTKERSLVSYSARKNPTTIAPPSLKA